METSEVEVRRLLPFALSLAGGLLMLSVGSMFLRGYLQWRSEIATHYSGPPLALIYLWLGCGATAIAASALLLILPRFPVAWGVTILVASLGYTAFIALWFADLAFGIAFALAGYYGSPGVLGVLGGGFALASPQGVLGR